MGSNYSNLVDLLYFIDYLVITEQKTLQNIQKKRIPVTTQVLQPYPVTTAPDVADGLLVLFLPESSDYLEYLKRILTVLYGSLYD